MEFLVDLGFEGFRCDAAYQVPEPFWRRLIGETKRKHPGVVFLAETLGCSPRETAQTAKAGFEFIFNSSKWWDYSSPWLFEQYNLTRETSKSVSFPESHDTPRLAEEVGGNVAAIKSKYFFSALFSAGVMMPMGFEFGFRKRLHVVKTRPQDWEETGVDLTAFITNLNRMKAANPVFQEDAPTEVLPAHNPNILFLWKGSFSANQEALIILEQGSAPRAAFLRRQFVSIYPGAGAVDRCFAGISPGLSAHALRIRAAARARHRAGHHQEQALSRRG